MAMQLQIGANRYPVASLAEASALYSELRDDSGEGASTWPTGHIVGTDMQVSYNGKVFQGRWFAGKKPVYDPYNPEHNLGASSRPLRGKALDRELTRVMRLLPGADVERLRDAFAAHSPRRFAEFLQTDLGKVWAAGDLANAEGRDIEAAMQAAAQAMTHGVGASSQPSRTRGLPVSVTFPSGQARSFANFDAAELELERMYPDVIFDELAAGGLVAMSSRGTVDGQARPVAQLHPPAGTQLAGVDYHYMRPPQRRAAVARFHAGMSEQEKRRLRADLEAPERARLRRLGDAETRAGESHEATMTGRSRARLLRAEAAYEAGRQRAARLGLNLPLDQWTPAVLESEGSSVGAMPARWSTQAPPPGKQIPAGWRWQPRAVSSQSGQFCPVCRANAGGQGGGGMFLEDDRFYLEADATIQSCGNPAHARQIYSPGNHGVGAMTEAARAKQRKANAADRAKGQRSAGKSELALLRQGVTAARELKRVKVAAIRVRCKALSEKARALRLEAAECRATARGVSAARGVDVLHARALVDAERKHQSSVRRYSKPAKLKRGAGQKPARSSSTLAAERRQHSDDEVEQSLPAELVPVWHAVKRHVKETPRMTRLEAFLHWAHDHPEQVYEITAAVDEKALRELERQEADHYARHGSSAEAPF